MSFNEANTQNTQYGRGIGLLSNTTFLRVFFVHHSTWFKDIRQWDNPNALCYGHFIQQELLNDHNEVQYKQATHNWITQLSVGYRSNNWIIRLSAGYHS